MYEKMTYEIILKRMLDRIPTNVDKREGSVIYDAVAPAAMEVMGMYLELERLLTETFGDTASRKYLIKRAAERGLSPTKATHAILKGEFNMDIAIGSRFSCSDLNYAAIEKITDGTYKMQCEASGEAGNKNLGKLIPIEYIEGLETAQLTEVLIPGEDEEDTEVFRERYFSSFSTQAFGGNQIDYIQKVKALSGVGGVKVYPVWNGGGTVKLVIIDSSFAVPSDTLVNQVQTAIDPTQNQGMGAGIAPIGHVVTVVGCGKTAVNIQTDITFQEGWNWEAIKPYAEKVIDEYFKELAKEWDSSDNLIIRISQIEIRLLNLTGVLDIANTILNGKGENLLIEADNIPIKGEISSV